MDYVITTRCVNGHEEQLFVDGMLGYEWVKEQADILDGTSSLYLHKPTEDSMIGKCGICKARYFCKVTSSHPGALDVKANSSD